MKPTFEAGGGPVSRTLLLIIQAALTVTSVLFLLLLWEENSLSGKAIWGLELFFTLHTAWAFLSWRLATGRMLDGYILFFTLLVLFSGGQMVLDSLGLLPEGLLDGVFRDSALTRGVLLVNASVCGFHMGALIRARQQRRACRPSTTVDHLTYRRIGLMFLAVSAAPMLKRMIENVTIVVASGYFALYQQTAKVGIDNWDAILAAFFVPGTIITFVTAPSSRANVRICWALALANSVANLFLGVRSLAGIALIPLILLHHSLVRPIRRSVILVGVFVGFLLIPWVANLRNLSLEERLTTSAWSTQPAEIAAVAGPKEMGGSMATIVMTVELIPTHRPFDYGLGYLRAILTVMPNLFWDVHPTVQAGLYGDWLIRQVDPDTADRGGGLGFSMIGEAFANFSSVGAPFAMLAMGWLLAAVVVWSRSNSDSTRLSIEALTLAAILLLPRSETATVVRSVIWTALLPYLAAALLKRKGTPDLERGTALELMAKAD